MRPHDAKDMNHRDAVVEIVGKPKGLAGLWPFFLQVWLVSAFGMYLSVGFVGLLFASFLILGLIPWQIAVARRGAYLVATLGEDGVTLRPLKGGRLSKRPFHFEWREVKQIRRTLLFAHHLAQALTIRLDRPHRFWTFETQPKHFVHIGPGLWEDPGFVRALTENVPSNRIEGKALDFKAPRVPTPYRITCGMLVLGCAAVAIWCALRLIVGPEGLGAGVMVVMALSVYIGCLACMLGLDGRSTAYGFLGGALLAWMSSLKMVVLWVICTGALSVLTGYLGASAGLLIGASLAMLGSKQAPRWPYVVLFYALGVFGFLAGWIAYDGIPETRVGVGNLSYVSPWTPQGDAFLITETPWLSQLRDEKSPVTLRWYSEDLRPGHSLSVLGRPSATVVGQNGALCVVRPNDDNRELWYVPRYAGKAKRLDAANHFWAIRRSPGGTLAVARLSTEEQQTWKVCDLSTGELRSLFVPVPDAEVRMVWIRDDGTLLWLTGSRPLDKGKNAVSRHTPLPPNGQFPYPGESYRIWRWKPGNSEDPAAIYAARTQWLGWAPSKVSEGLYVCRIAETPPPRVEYVEVDLSTSECIVSSASDDVLDWDYGMRTNGRFVVREEEGLFGRLLVADLLTGKTRRIRTASPLLAGLEGPWWSPTANRFLLAWPKWVPAQDFWSWHWYRDPKRILTFEHVVHLVDLGE